MTDLARCAVVFEEDRLTFLDGAEPVARLAVDDALPVLLDGRRRGGAGR